MGGLLSATRPIEPPAAVASNGGANLQAFSVPSCFRLQNRILQITVPAAETLAPHSFSRLTSSSSDSLSRACRTFLFPSVQAQFLSLQISGFQPVIRGVHRLAPSPLALAGSAVMLDPRQPLPADHAHDVGQVARAFS